MIPPRSPFGLIQEDLWPDAWLILIACMMLNCTSRKQVEGVLPEFRRRWPTPQAFMAANPDEVAAVCRSLGFANRRTQNMMKMTRVFLAAPWQHARELPGIGDYAARAWEIFCRGELGGNPPNDHALTAYWHWRKHHDEAKPSAEDRRRRVQADGDQAGDRAAAEAADRG